MLENVSRPVYEVNRIGLHYKLEAEGDGTKITLSMKGVEKTLVVKHSLQLMQEGWNQWRWNDALVQNAFRFLTAEEREFLQTGITPDEWKEMFGKED